MHKIAENFGISKARLAILMEFFEKKLHDEYAFSWGGLITSIKERFADFATDKVILEEVLIDGELLQEELDFLYMHVAFVCDYCQRSYLLEDVEVITKQDEMFCRNCAERNDINEEE